MNQILRLGQTVKTETTKKDVRVDTFLGGGGQGEVYRATFDGAPVALKWYFPQTGSRDQRGALELVVKKGAPDRRFLWPMELASARGVPAFGYIMPLRPANYKSIVDLMKRRVEPTFRTLATAGFQLADSFLQLHAKGLCYRDISFGNVFFDPKSGDVLIADNDNVGVEGQTRAGVLGTPRFMAPEVVRGDAMPSTQTDLYSLAVLLFYMLMVHHPLEGRKELDIKCLDLPAMNKLYGTEPVFIFDPQDASNRPVPGYHDNAIAFWPIYPQFIRDLFTKAFTDGIRDPQNGRVRESEWRAAMVRLRDSILYCGNCGAENFYDADALKASGGQPGTCWSCGKDLALPFRLQVNRNTVMLNYDTKLYPHHVDDSRLYDFSAPVAEVTRHPTNPSIWGLKNLSAARWVTTTAEGVVHDVEPGRSVSLANGTRINFGKAEGEVRL